ncbi:glycosyltransferase family 4 protein [Bradyrhizobium lablabi]|uniref:glycosyltransferase family 4 protein n=1 Tax=Bradyrhizobium lablabi TaxID=722472 RepID=UPI0018D35B66|nr:glycosyltransferase family 4 protein [Bradyrhizobium lablabi]
MNALDRRKGAKIYFIQGHEVFPHLPVSRSRETYRLPMHKIVVAKWLQDIMREEYDDISTDLVPNSIDKMQFFSCPRRQQSVPTVGFLYSDASVKGVDVTLAALKTLRQRHPELRIVSFGASRTSAKLPLPDRTEFYYFPKQDEIRKIYCSCDVWVTASRSEGFNLTAMEAMACRTPVVSTRTGWPAESIRSGWNGFLVEIDDIDSIVNGVEAILSQNDDAWKTMSSNAYATVRESSWSESVALFERALYNGCRRAKKGRYRENATAKRSILPETNPRSEL